MTFMWLLYLLQVNSDENDQCQEKTMCTADDEFMDMTQSHTSNIASGPLAPQQMAADGLDSEFKQFLSSLSKSSGPGVNPAMPRMMPTAEALSVTLQDCESLKRVEMTSGQKNSKVVSSYKGIEIISPPGCFHSYELKTKNAHYSGWVLEIVIKLNTIQKCNIWKTVVMLLILKILYRIKNENVSN